ncbi:hypothetical protein C8R46DRAFT_1073648 [Mycena filopes]|nr:hypothetical protein C8R46DRAFT_1073648 [Mycena filopes]
MPLGEIPITSYFNRAPAPKKRKQNAPSAPTKAPKRRRADSEEDVKAPKKQVLLAFPKATRKAVGAAPASPQGRPPTVNLEARVPPSSDSSLTATPLTRRSSSSPMHTPNSPMLPEDSPVPSSLHSRSPPITPPRPRRKSDAGKGKSVAFARLPSLSFRQADVPELTPDRGTDDGVLPPSSVVSSSRITSPNLHRSSPGGRFDDSVPSSQSQYFLPFQSPRQNDSPPIDFVPSSQSQYWPPTAAEPLDRDDDGFVVPSSQSQWLLPLHLNGVAIVTTDVAEDEIPSSQSQFEVELRPQNTSQRRASSVPSLLSALRRSAPLNLSLDVEDMFEEGSVEMAKVTAHKDKDDSATESDGDILVIPPRPPVPAPPPPPSQHDGYSLPPGGFSSCIDESMPDEGSLAGSLPEAVKDFYDMLDDGGSYPASFPESLRGKWDCGGTPEESEA